MKKILALILSVMILTAFLPALPVGAVPATVEADPVGKPDTKTAPAPENQAKPLLGKDALEKVVSLVKSKLTIPESFTEFTGDVYDNGGKTAFRLRWANNNYYSQVYGSLEVNVDENGIVNNYYFYSYDRNYDYGRRLPKITMEQAWERAKRFLAVLCPDIAGRLSYETALQRGNIEYDGSYTFNFFRAENGIPYYENNVYLQVNGQTGNVSNMSRNWDDTLVFPKDGQAISPDKAKEAWKKEIGLKLGYRFLQSQNGGKPILRYSPDAANMLYAIDAATGKKMAVNTSYNPYYDYGYRYDYFVSSVSESEIDEIGQIKDFLDPDEGEKLARGMTELGIDSAFKLNRYSYNRTSNGNYVLQLDFQKAASKEEMQKFIPPEKLNVMIAAGDFSGYGSVSCSFDAVTSELFSFSSSGNVDTGKNSLTREELQKTAEAFLTKYKSARFGQTELAESTPYANDYMMKFGIASPENSGSFIYKRKVNGITVEDNSININVDMYTGKIVAYSEVWDDVDFPTADGIISLDKAYDVIFGQCGFELRYMAAADPGVATNGILVQSGVPANQNIKLVYAPGNGKPLMIDAAKGVLINGGTGDEFMDKNGFSYGDLDGNSHKADIEILARSGLLPLEKNFRPDAPMLQKDFLAMVLLLRGSSVPGISDGEFTQTEQDSMYRQLINDGLLDESEREPDSCVTRLSAVKLLLKSAGYAKFAEMKGIFDYSYTDKADIAPDMLGYAAIAGSLGLVDGPAFEPAKKLTRLEAVMMIYRYVNK